MGKKTDRLDDAFLFTLSLVGLLISFILVSMKDLNELLEAIPFLMLGIGLPFYVGYMKGAIEKDSLTERMRGWTYLIIGTALYFTFFTSTWLRMNYSDFQLVHSQILIILVSLSISLVTYRLLRWTKRVFKRRFNQYAFSGTAFSAFCFAFMFSLLIGLYHDYYGKDVIKTLTTGSTEMFFWITIVLALFLFVLMGEKASADVSQADLRLPNYRRVTRITRFFVVKGLLLGSILMEYAIDYNLKARLLLLQAFVFWFLACIFWIARVPFVPLVLFILAISMMSLAGMIFLRTETIDFAGIETRTPEKLSYCLVVFAITVSMVFAGFNQLLVLYLVLLTIVFCTPYLVHIAHALQGSSPTR